MTSRPRVSFRVPVLPGVIAVLLGLLGASCSDAVEDDVERACRVVVEDCDVGTSIGGCLDRMGELGAACIECIAGGAASGDAGRTTCGYSACQRLPSCRIPDALLPPADRKSARVLGAD